MAIQFRNPFVNPLSIVPQGVGVGGFSGDAIRAAYAQGAQSAGDIARMQANAQAMRRVTPGAELKAFERESRFFDRQNKAEKKMWDKWMKNKDKTDRYFKDDPVYGGLVNTASYIEKTADPSVAGLMAKKAPEGNKPRVLDILPFLGGVGGLYMALRKPGATAKFLDVPKELPKASRLVLGTGVGSSIGFLPGVSYDAYNAMFNKSSSDNSPILDSLRKVQSDAHNLGKAAALGMTNHSCWPMPGMDMHKDHQKGGDERMIAKSLDSLAAQSLELKKRVEAGTYRMPSWAEYKVYKAHDAIKDALSSSFTMHKPKIRITIIKAAEEGAKLAAYSVLRAKTQE